MDACIVFRQGLELALLIQTVWSHAMSGERRSNIGVIVDCYPRPGKKMRINMSFASLKPQPWVHNTLVYGLLPSTRPKPLYFHTTRVWQWFLVEYLPSKHPACWYSTVDRKQYNRTDLLQTIHWLRYKQLEQPYVDMEVTSVIYDKAKRQAHYPWAQ